ncbi:hypothetical protein BDW22DRAFT_1357849 [Trametopsis cervina]|nr:hypothetical protein BDW22DRAFT_1357849 [Trametopsis cervina]
MSQFMVLGSASSRSLTFISLQANEYNTPGNASTLARKGCNTSSFNVNLTCLLRKEYAPVGEQLFWNENSEKRIVLDPRASDLREESRHWKFFTLRGVTDSEA